MKRILVFVLSLCLLLPGCSILPGANGAPADPILPGTDITLAGFISTGTSSTPGDSRENAYNALSCGAQDFSVLFDKGFTAVSSEAGATIFIGDKDALNKVDISVIYDGDTTGFDVTEYFYFRAGDMESEDGIKYTLYQERTQSSVGNGVMNGAAYSFPTGDGTAYRYERLVDTGTQLISYSCYIYGGGADKPITAMADAIKSYQPSADYYDSHPLVIGGEPAPTAPDSAKLPEPASGTLGRLSL